MVRPHAALFTSALGIFAAIALIPAPAQAQQEETPINYESARVERRLQAVRAIGPITVDGALDEPAWAAAPMASTSSRTTRARASRRPSTREVRVLYDDDALYFGVFAKDDEPGRLIVNDLKKDFNTDGSDGFRIILDTFHDERNGYQFATNPAGAKWDAQMANEGRENNANWDGIWDVDDARHRDRVGMRRSGFRSAR